MDLSINPNSIEIINDFAYRRIVERLSLLGFNNIEFNKPFGVLLFDYDNLEFKADGMDFLLYIPDENETTKKLSAFCASEANGIIIKSKIDGVELVVDFNINENKVDKRIKESQKEKSSTVENNISSTGKNISLESENTESSLNDFEDEQYLVDSNNRFDFNETIDDSDDTINELTNNEVNNISKVRVFEMSF